MYEIDGIRMSKCKRHNRHYFKALGCLYCEQDTLRDKHLAEAVANSLEPHDTLTCDLKDGEFKNGRRGEV